jgi:DNA mismatch endonuclease, patch repair protein
MAGPIHGGGVDPKRSALMARVRGKDTKPELVVRRIAHSLGYRFRLHTRALPGTPDLVFPRLRSIIFVHGCFWHRHLNCRRTTDPKTRVSYWQTKFRENVERDRRKRRELKALGWRVLTIWECQTLDTSKLERRLRNFLV